MIDDGLMSQALEWLADADALLVTAGAGMGVDSGLPDFRGGQGLWRAYPALAQAQIPLERIAHPSVFKTSPRLAWGFYGHRLAMYRRVVPHRGFEILHAWGQRMARGFFVYTSNVDGHFQKAGFSSCNIHEVHGSIHHLQCVHRCTDAIWSSDGFIPEVDETRCHLLNEMPVCPQCGGLARPNILFFEDYEWIEARSERQRALRQQWLSGASRLVVVEIGAGTSLPTVRRYSERHGPRVIRINPQEAHIEKSLGLSLSGNALNMLIALDGAR